MTDEEQEDDDDDDDVCVACGDGVDSSEEIQKLIEEKSQENED